jgi:hypothetical protein
MRFLSRFRKDLITVTGCTSGTQTTMAAYVRFRNFKSPGKRLIGGLSQSGSESLLAFSRWSDKSRISGTANLLHEVYNHFSFPRPQCAGRAPMTCGDYWDRNDLPRAKFPRVPAPFDYPKVTQTYQPRRRRPENLLFRLSLRPLSVTLLITVVLCTESDKWSAIRPCQCLYDISQVEAILREAYWRRNGFHTPVDFHNWPHRRISPFCYGPSSGKKHEESCSCSSVLYLSRYSVNTIYWFWVVRRQGGRHYRKAMWSWSGESVTWVKGSWSL